MTREQKKEALTAKGVEFKGNLSNVDLDALYIEHIGELPVEEVKEEPKKEEPKKEKTTTKMFIHDGKTYKKTYNEKGDSIKVEVVE